LISGVPVGGYNGIVNVVSVLSPTKFTYTNTTTGLLASGGGTVATTTGGGISELQSLTVTNAAATFTVTFNGQVTGSLASNIPASSGGLGGPTASLENALNALLTIGGVGGRVSVNKAGNIYTVSFGGALAGLDQPQLVATGSGGTIVVVNTMKDGDGPALELQKSNPLNDGGLSTGVGIWNEHLILSGTGNSLFADAPLTVLSSDNLWHGPVTLQTSSDMQVAPRRSIDHLWRHR